MIPIQRPDTGRAKDMTDEEYAAWRDWKRMGNARATAAAEGAAIALREAPVLVDAVRVFAAQFPHYRLSNVLRVWAQNHQATRVQGARWWSGEGREVPADATPIWIKAAHKRTKYEERVNATTGTTEKVATGETIRNVDGEPVFDISQTVRNDGTGCIICRAEPGQPCPDDCPVHTGPPGRIPTRREVLTAAHRIIEKLGGLDVEEALAALGDDPYPPGSQVRGTNWLEITVPKPGGKGTRKLLVHVSHDEQGRTRYAVLNVGVFVLGLDPTSYDRDQGRSSNRLRVQYGDDPGTGKWEADQGSVARPNAPVINTITLAGHGVFDPHRSTPDGKNGPHVGRPGYFGTKPVPDKTEQAAGRIIHHLVRHWLAQPGLEELKAAHDRHHAPQRQVEHAHRAARLREQVEALAAELAEQEEAAARQAALAAQAGETS